MGFGTKRPAAQLAQLDTARSRRSPPIRLIGEVDITNAAELSELVTGQLTGDTLHLTIDVGGVEFADTAGIRVFVPAAKRLRQRGGGLVLLRPQRALARVLEILGAGDVITIRTGPDTTL